jgi:hypothetical protein
MKITIYVAIATKHEEEEVLAAGMNRRLIEITKDSFLMKNIEWSAEIQEFEIEVKAKQKPRVFLQEEEHVETGKTVHKVDTTITKEKAQEEIANQLKQQK